MFFEKLKSNWRIEYSPMRKFLTKFFIKEEYFWRKETHLTIQIVD